MTFRHCFAYVLLAVVTAWALALYVQIALAIAPCPLCSLQRLAYLLIGIIAVIAWLHAPTNWGRDVYFTLTSLTTLAGLAVALRQVWLEYFTAQGLPETCGPGVGEMLRIAPTHHVLTMAFAGHGSCRDIQMPVLGLSMAAWSAVMFGLILVVLLWGWAKTRPL